MMGRRGQPVDWKNALRILVFAACLAPYLVIALFTGLEDLVYFFLVWSLFILARPLLPPRLAIVIPVICGILLAFPVSAFLYIGQGRVLFLSGRMATETVVTVTARLLYFSALMLVAHYLTRPVRASRSIGGSKTDDAS
jgi:hypothetical protein